MSHIRANLNNGLMELKHGHFHTRTLLQKQRMVNLQVALLLLFKKLAALKMKFVMPYLKGYKLITAVRKFNDL